jgi:hypothetical protein
MISELEKARHADEKGAILQALSQNYAAKMTSVRALVGALDLLGHAMTSEGMQFALMYLADCEYIKIWRNEDLPGWRPDRMNDTHGYTIVFARLLPKGLLLIDGRIAADPGVRF